MVSGPFEAVSEAGAERRRAVGLGGKLPRSLLPEMLEQADRWPLWMPVCVAAGVAAYFSLPVEPHGAVFALALLAGVGFGIGARKGWAMPASLFLSAFLLGFVLAKARAEAVRAPVLRATSGPVTVVGVIEDARPARRSMLRLAIVVDRIDGIRPEAWPAVVEVTARPPAGGIGPGDRVTLKARLSPPPRPVEPGGYDPALRLWFEGVGATGFSLEAPSVEPGRGVSFKGSVEAVRDGIASRVAAALAPLQASIATALITGERAAIPEAVNDHLRASGLYHILSISGLHLTLVAGAVFGARRAGLALSPRLALNHPIKKWAAASSLLAALCYLAISGAEVATQRAVLMLAIMYLAVMLDRPALSMRNVAVAGLAILVWTPEALVSASFQMSFLAVLGLIALVEVHAAWRQGRPPAAGPGSVAARLGRFLLATLVVTAVTTLIASLLTSLPAAYHFNRVAYYAVLANVLAVPLVSFIIMPAGLVATALMPVGLEAGPLHLMALGIDGTLAISRWVASLPGSTAAVRSMPALAALSMSAGSIWVCLWRGKLRAWGAVPLLVGLLLAPWGARPDILIENTARNVAVRTPEGLLAVAHPRRARYAVERWLLKDGDDVTPQVAARRAGWTCADHVCRASVKGRRVVYASEPAADALPCVDADILIADFPLRGRCRGVPTRIDRFDVWRDGAYALSISSQGDVGIATVARARGVRPWTARPVARRTILEGDGSDPPPEVQE